MTGRMIDVAIVGGGLAGGLTALALHRARPELRIALLEAGKVIGGNHRWSWFASDLPPGGEELLAPFRKMEWDDGYDVRFPKYVRTLGASYRSMASEDFAAGLKRELPAGTIRTNCRVAALDAEGVTLADQERIPARTVIDCRNFTATPDLAGGWQLFLGRQMRTAKPHKVTRPVIMDASVEQHDAYRFVYVLPLGAHDLFIEDTYYGDSPKLNRSALSSRIDAYCRQFGWDGEIVGNETGVLPVITGGDLRAFRDAHQIDGVTLAGARGGFSHPLTSYTLPTAIGNALAIAEESDLIGPHLAAIFDARAKKHWSSTKFYRDLGRMLFDAAEPNERYRIFEKFYQLPEALIERFYAGESTMLDRARVLSGKPPVSITRAMAALAGSGTPLVTKPPVTKDAS